MKLFATPEEAARIRSLTEIRDQQQRALDREIDYLRRRTLRDEERDAILRDADEIAAEVLSAKEAP